MTVVKFPSSDGTGGGIEGGLQYRGFYNDFTTYNTGDIVRYGPSGFIALQDNMVNVDPSDDQVNWAAIGSEGPPGLPGAPQYAGIGPPGLITGAHPGEVYLDLTNGNIYSLT